MAHLIKKRGEKGEREKRERERTRTRGLDTYPKLHNKRIDDGANHGDEVKCVPGVLEKILGEGDR